MRNMNRLWRALFPLKVGDRVRYIRNTAKKRISKQRKEMFNNIGEITEEIDQKYKRYLVWMGFYPEKIMGERCYQVSFPEHRNTNFTFRQEELEGVGEDET